MAEIETENELLQSYLSEDPIDLPAEELSRIADVFGLSMEDVSGIVQGMHDAREEVRAQELETEGQPEAVNASGWRARWDFHLAGQHDQSSHGSWAADGDVAPATSRYGTDPGKIRRWAIREGKDVGARGRLGPEIVKEYDDLFGPGERATDAKKPTNSELIHDIHPGMTDAEKRTVYRKSAQKAIPALAAFGGSLDVRDDTWDPASDNYSPEVAQHLVDLSKIPSHLVSEFVGAGGRVIVGNGPITDIGGPELARLKGVQPRGWPAGTSYDNVAGVFSPSTGTVVLGNIPGAKNTPVSNFAFHEFGHGMDALRKKVSLLSAEDSFHELHNEFTRVARASGHLNSYYVQSSTPGAGASEFFADSMRGYLKGLAGDSELRNGVIRNSFAEAGTYVSIGVADKILAHMDGKFGVGSAGGKSVSEPKPAVVEPKPKRAYVQTKKRAIRDISFAEESRARSLRRSGKTLEEISDELKIAVSTLSKILGGGS